MAEVTGGVSAEQLRSFIERLENLEEEKRAVQEQLKEVFAEAKGEGFDVKVIRQILRLRRQKPHERASWTSCWRSTSRRSA
jgi:uncharacterized protein (UPF0335 family)